MTEVWGTLAKSQIDPQTINEAITAAIADHEADTSAHVDVGESLYSHKASEVIDHIARSVVADKFQQDLFSYNMLVFPLITLDPFTISATYSSVGLGCILIRTSQVLNNTATIENIPAPISTVVFDEDVYWEMTAQFYSESGDSGSRDGFIGMGLDGVDFLGFKISANVVYAHSNDGGSASYTDVELTGVTASTNNAFSIKYYNGVKAEFYVGGVLKATITTNLPTDAEALPVYGWVKTKTTGKYATLRFGSFAIALHTVLES